MMIDSAKLLLVDDDPAAIQVMSRMLDLYPNQRFATSGADALRLSHESNPDLIVLDADMPGMTGFEVCDAIRADPALARIPIIFATSHEDPEMEVAALKRGASDYVTKPLVASQLTARVRAQLRTRQLVTELKLDDSTEFITGEVETGGKPRVLIVDDDATAIQILHRTLSDMGDFTFATNGEEALEQALKCKPDLILLDANMPGVDGYGVCASLKSIAAFTNIPIIFVTRHSDPRNEMRALDLGAAEFITKPYTPAVLRVRVRNLLELKRNMDAQLRGVGEHWRKVGDARVADIVGAASDAIVSCDAQGKVVLANNAAGRMFGLKQRALVGRDLHSLLGVSADALQTWPTGPARILVPREDDAPFPAEASVSHSGTGDDALTTVVLRDVSDRERLEAESRARAQAEAASHMKTRMISYVAHEMGNPINGLLGFAELMAVDTAHPLVPAQKEVLDLIVASANNLQDLLRDVLDLGRVETGLLEIDLQPADAVRCIRDAVATVTQQALQAGVMVLARKVNLPLRIVADVKRLNQCLLNLLTNAIKYNRRGGRAEVALSSDEKSVTISVRDNGIGMSREQIDHLFEPFNRLGRQKSETPGAGLGLLITRQLVHAMNGDLRVDSAPDKGSCFSIVLPRSADAATH